LLRQNWIAARMLAESHRSWNRFDFDAPDPNLSAKAVWRLVCEPSLACKV
jgi:hypothetical protein